MKVKDTKHNTSLFILNQMTGILHVLFYCSICFKDCYMYTSNVLDLYFNFINLKLFWKLWWEFSLLHKVLNKCDIVTNFIHLKKVQINPPKTKMECKKAPQNVLLIKYDILWNGVVGICTEWYCFDNWFYFSSVVLYIVLIVIYMLSQICFRLSFIFVELTEPYHYCLSSI